ncbi:MAG TPA: serine protease, partial [Allosphingosinicella sp.]
MKQIGRRCAMAAGVALSLLLAGSAAAAPELDNFEFLQTSSVRVVTYYPGQVAFGTGWIATASEARNANNAVIVTAAHIVRGANRITILEANSAEEHEANVRAIDLDRDLAFLEVRGLRSGGTPLRVTTVVPPIGQELRTTGYTSASDRPSRRELAEVSGVLMGAYSRSIPNPRPIWEYADVGVAQFQHSITLSPGFSGGPVIDKCGRVVGINVSNGTEVRVPGGALDLAPGISFAVNSAEILKA